MRHPSVFSVSLRSKRIGKPHVSGRETRYLQALLWVSGPRSVRVFTTKQGGRLGPGNQGGVGWGCGVCVCGLREPGQY